MTARLLPFRETRRAPPPAIAPFRALLVKGRRKRLYQILMGGTVGVWQTWVRFDGKPHRAHLVRHNLREVERIRAEYQREIAELLEDGWTIAR